MKRVISLICVVLFFLSCDNGGNGEEQNGTTQPKQPEQRVAKGDVALGGTFMISENEKYQTLFPHNVKDLGSSHIISQIYEGLVRLSQKDLTVIPAIAERWEVNEDSTEYIFHLRDDVHFHDDPAFEGGKGRKVTAKDFKYSFELLCKKSDDNTGYESIFKGCLLGADEYHKGEIPTISGIEIIDEKTLKLKLTAPNYTFLYKLANPMGAVISEEAYKKYGANMKVGTGPFIFIDKGNPEVELLLARNRNYYKVDSLGNQLPYIDTVHFKFISTKTGELNAFTNNELSIIDGLPADKVKEVVMKYTQMFQNQPPKFILYFEPEMATQYYAFNLTREIFQDVRVRKAFSYAIDRERIIEKVLNGQAFMPGHYGITPPVRRFKGYDTAKIGGYSFNPEKAKQLMREAGYPNGEGFPSVTLEFNSGGARNTRVATEIVNQLRANIGVNVNTEVVSLTQKVEDASYGKTADIYRSAWVADYPSPEIFLLLGYGGNIPETQDQPSHPNTMRYKNPEFDALFEKAMRSPSKEERYDLFAQAEKIMMDDAPMIILWYDSNYKILQSHVRNFYHNPMTYYDFSNIYLKERKGEVKSAG